MGLFDRLFGKKPQAEPIPMKTPQEEQKPAPVEKVEKETAPEAVATVAPVVEAEAEAAVAAKEETISAEALQRKLDRYFARLREVYPDGVIVRLNTGHKKLAERGAQLRRLTGDEGNLDAFFARGGFTYQRSGGGRPALDLQDVAAVEARVRALFPNGVTTAMALRDQDHRLYLDLRALARREEVTVSAWLAAHGLAKA